MPDSGTTAVIRETVREAVAQAVEALVNTQQRGYLDTTLAADYVGFSKPQLEIWRSQGGGPPYLKLARAVRYSRADLDEWMASHRQSHTGQNR